MNERNFNTLNELEDFVNCFPDEPKCIFDIKKLETGQGFLLSWQEQKYYISAEGKRCPDEVWVTKNGTALQVQDISEDHLKNILRTIIRQRREYDEMVHKAMHREEDQFLLDDESDIDPDIESITLH